MRRALRPSGLLLGRLLLGLQELAPWFMQLSPRSTPPLNAVHHLCLGGVRRLSASMKKLIPTDFAVSGEGLRMLEPELLKVPRPANRHFKGGK